MVHLRHGQRKGSEDDLEHSGLSQGQRVGGDLRGHRMQGQRTKRTKKKKCRQLGRKQGETAHGSHTCQLASAVQAELRDLSSAQTPGSAEGKVLEPPSKHLKATGP